MLLLVLKNAKKKPNGKYMKNFLKPFWYIDNVYFVKELVVKFNLIKIQFFTSVVF